MELTAAAIQMAMADDLDANVATAERLVRDAAAEGAQVDPDPRAVRGAVLLQGHAARALRPSPRRSTATRRSSTSAPSPPSSASCCRSASTSGPARRRSTRSSIVDADGSVLGTYRKSHIPDGPGYTEKYYFNPGDTGFRVWDTPVRHGRRRHLLGPVVPRVGPLHGAARRRGAAATRRRSAASRPTRRGTRAGTGSG